MDGANQCHAPLFDGTRQAAAHAVVADGDDEAVGAMFVAQAAQVGNRAEHGNTIDATAVDLLVVVHKANHVTGFGLEQDVEDIGSVLELVDARQQPEAAVEEQKSNMAVEAPPAQIGQGQLQAGKVGWKPGDPFGVGKIKTRFKWEVLISTACGTAVCGLLGIWLLRTLLS